jgi:hypothetical protein
MSQANANNQTSESSKRSLEYETSDPYEPSRDASHSTMSPGVADGANSAPDTAHMMVHMFISIPSYSVSVPNITRPIILSTPLITQPGMTRLSRFTSAISTQ